ncbi:hypothetical protein Q5P01_002893 [Channa striata]|uniref:G-protein coupled receptors family 1 profile domain-containing protein n=1 Tax=Channa striata TaxID=64152 RepID=A0AA88TED9_CHASR|nr:hypothetical protein Q5P01_002893 [Channa striata]
MPCLLASCTPLLCAGLSQGHLCTACTWGLAWYGRSQPLLILYSEPAPTDMTTNSSFSSFSDIQRCSSSSAAVLMALVYLFIKIFVLFPLSLLVLCLGLQRWRQQRSFAATSHSDIFTYHSAAMELIYVLGVCIYICGLFFGLSEITKIGYYLYCIVFPGQTSIHILTCVERYLAVIHPLIYVRLKQSGGVRIRNISIGCVWLLCFGWIGVTALHFPDIPYTQFFCLLALSFIAASFCNISVLCALIHPGPGKMGGNREQVDQSKQRAFYTITAILGVLLLGFVGYLVCLAVVHLHADNYLDHCLALVFGNMVTLPSSSVLPLLFLHRAGKLVCCNCSEK